MSVITSYDASNASGNICFINLFVWDLIRSCTGVVLLFDDVSNCYGAASVITSDEIFKPSGDALFVLSFGRHLIILCSGLDLILDDVCIQVQFRL